MPRLPDDSVLGGLPEANSRRPIATFDTSGPGEAMQALGRGISNMGAGIGSGINALASEQDETALLKARSGYATEKVTLDERLSRATDPAETDQIIKENEALVTKWGSSLRGRNAERWNFDFAPRVAEFGVKARDRSFALSRDKDIADASDQMDLMRELAIDPKVDEQTRQLAIDTGNDWIDNLQSKGYITAQDAQSRRKQWVETYVWDRAKMLPAEQRAYAVGGIEGALIAKESSGNPSIVNGFGFAGLYQFGAPRLQTLGLYSPGSNEDMGGWNKSGRGSPGKWSGSFNIPGFPQVKTLQDFLANPDAQRKAWDAHSAYMDKEISSRNLDQYIGQTVGGVTITRDGIKAMIHLGGAGGAKAVLDSGGRVNPSDANGTTLLKYAGMATGKDSAIMNILPPDKRQQMMDYTYKEIAAERSQAVQVAAAESKVRQNDLEVRLHDGSATQEDIVAARQQGWLNDYDAIKKLEGIAETTAKKNEAINLGAQILAGGTKLDPLDPKHKEASEALVENITKMSGGKVSPWKAAEFVFEKSGHQYMPKAGSRVIRNGLNSQDFNEVREAAQVASNAITNNPRAFDETEGGGDIEKSAVKFRHLVYDLGLSADDAAKRMILEKSEEYKRKNRVNDADVKKFSDDIKKGAINDLQNASFPGSHFFFDNNIGAPKARDAISEDYAELATMHYQENGNLKEAKAYAITQLNKLYGVSNGVVMKYPPEKVYPPVGKDGHAYIYQQAAEAVKQEAGVDVKPSDLAFVPVDKQRTGAAWKAMRETPYDIAYKNPKTGMIELLLFGKGGLRGFVASPDTEQTRLRLDAERGFNAARAAVVQQSTPDPTVNPADVSPRKWNPGRPVKTGAERQAEAEATTASRQKSIDEAKAAAEFATRGARDRDKNLDAARKALEAEAPGTRTLGEFIADTPKNPLEKFPYKPKSTKPKYETGGSF